MAATREAVESVVREFLARIGKDSTVDLTAPLYADGIGLDSLETAELSAILEDDFETEPFSEGEMPQTLADVLDHYGPATESSSV